VSTYASRYSEAVINASTGSLLKSTALTLMQTGTGAPGTGTYVTTYTDRTKSSVASSVGAVSTDANGNLGFYAKAPNSGGVDIYQGGSLLLADVRPVQDAATALVGQGFCAPAGSLDVWRAALATANSALIETVFVGDSTTVGVSSSGTNTPITQLLRNRSIAAGYSDGGRGAAPAGLNDTAADSGIDNLALVQANTGYVTADAFDMYGSNVPRSTTYNDIITYQGKGTRCRIQISRHYVGGRWSYSVNGGSFTNYDQVDPAAPPYYQPDWIEITGLPGSGATNTVRIRNEGGRKLVPFTATPSAQTPIGSGGTLSAGTYYYVVTAVGRSGESVASPFGSQTITGGQTVNFLINNDFGTGAQPGYGRSMNVYRATSSGGPYRFLKTVALSAGTQTTWTDDGTVATTSQAPPVSTADTTDGQNQSNLVKVTVEFYNDHGIVWHNAGVAGSTSALYGDTTDASFNQNAQALFGLGPVVSDGAWANLSTIPGGRKPKLILINFGINDNGVNTADQTANNLSNLVRMAQATGASVVVVVPPLTSANSNVVNPRTTQGVIRKAIWDVGMSHGCAVIDLGVALGRPGQYSANGYGLVPGNPHPSATGYGVQADLIWAVLAP
jgi:hypothetical protein